MLERVAYQEPGQRGRHEYQLTEKGLELLPALIALMQWGDRWTAGPRARRSRFCTAAAAVRSAPLWPASTAITP